VLSVLVFAVVLVQTWGQDLGTSLFLREGECNRAGLNKDWSACEKPSRGLLLSQIINFGGVA